MVLNPHAGQGRAATLWPALRAELEARGLRWTLVHEANAAGALARVQALPVAVPLLAVGGDGTVRALLDAVAGTGRPLAALPLGTGNDYAGMLGWRAGDVPGAVDRVQSPPRPVDALRATLHRSGAPAETRWLLNGLGMGFDAQVAANMARAPGGLHGFPRYVWAAVATVRELSLTPVDIVLDGQHLYRGPSALVAVMNGTRYGGGFQISPRSRVADGRLNVLASRDVTRGQLLALMARVLPGRHLGHPRVVHGEGQRVTVRWAHPIQLHVDGDLHGEVDGVEVQVCPGVVHLLGG